MYLVGYNVLICAVLVPLLYWEAHRGTPLVKAAVLTLELDLDQQLAVVYVFLCVFLLPVMLAGLEWSVSVLERVWPTSQAMNSHDHSSFTTTPQLMLTLPCCLSISSSGALQETCPDTSMRCAGERKFARCATRRENCYLT